MHFGYSNTSVELLNVLCNLGVLLTKLCTACACFSLLFNLFSLFIIGLTHNISEMIRGMSISCESKRMLLEDEKIFILLLLYPRNEV